MSEHTKEPWIVTGSDRIKYIEARIGNGQLQEIASCMMVGHGDHEANSSRIVECVNALAGIDDPELWVAKMKFMDSDHTASLEIIGELTKQHDELLAALKMIANHIPTMMRDDRQHEVIVYPPEFNPAKIAREAIAKEALSTPPNTAELDAYVQQKLLQSQASEARLREALSFIKPKIETLMRGSREKEWAVIENRNGEIVYLDSAIVVIDKALSTPPNAAALEAYVESEVEKRFKVVAWQGLGICMLQKPISDADLFSPLYARKDKQ
jgi:hypothetical protein